MCWEPAHRAPSVSPWPRLRVALRWDVIIVSFVPSVAPRTSLSRSRVGRAPRAGARTHVERDARGRPAWGVRAPRALGESAAAFTRRSSLGVWHRFVRPVRRPARAALSLGGPAPAGRARTTSGRVGARRARRVRSVGRRGESAHRAPYLAPVFCLANYERPFSFEDAPPSRPPAAVARVRSSLSLDDDDDNPLSSLPTLRRRRPPVSPTPVRRGTFARGRVFPADAASKLDPNPQRENSPESKPPPPKRDATLAAVAEKQKKWTRGKKKDDKDDAARKEKGDRRCRCMCEQNITKSKYKKAESNHSRVRAQTAHSLLLPPTARKGASSITTWSSESS